MSKLKKQSIGGLQPSPKKKGSRIGTKKKERERRKEEKI